MKLQLLEASANSDAAFIGKGNGYDVFEIKTFEAANTFNIKGHSNWKAGEIYFDTEEIFNNNVGGASHFYLITSEGTNDSCASLLVAPDICRSLLFSTRRGHNIFYVNFLFRDALQYRASEEVPNPELPFYLIPGAALCEDTFAQDKNNPYVVIQNKKTLYTILPQWKDSTKVYNYVVPDNIVDISSNFTRMSGLDNIILNKNIENIEYYALDNVKSRIFVPFTQQEAVNKFGYQWSSGKTVVYNVDADGADLYFDADRDKAEVQARLLTLPEDQREIAKLRYKETPKEIYITGIKPGVTSVDIPEYIHGKPVTKIEAYAFYKESQLYSITVPDTVRKIEHSAFSGVSCRVIVNPKCIIGKYNDKVETY